MKLILRHNWSIPWEASGTENYPFEYSSKEDAFVDFTDAYEKAEYRFDFLGREFYKGDDNDYDFYELDEWFERFKINKQ